MNKTTTNGICPNEETLKKLHFLAEENNNDCKWIEIAKWALENTMNPDTFGKTYELHLKLFEDIKDADDKAGYLIDFDLRYAISKNLEDAIRRDFGDYALDKINENT